METLALLKNKFVKREIDDGLFRDIYECMKFYGINVNYRNDDNRVLFNLLRRNDIIDNKYKRECNGLIIDIEKWQIVCLPSFNFQRSRDVNTKNVDMDEYDLVDVQDGSVISLYNYYDEWILSTYNSIDVRDSQWVNSFTTFSAAITEILHRRQYDLDFERLSKTKSYTFGFKHPDFHPFDEGEGNYKMWFIQSVDLEKIHSLNILSANEYSDKIISYEDESIGKDIKSQNSVKSFEVISELHKYLNNNHDNSYGFLLRNKNIKKDSILIESILMINIKRYYYDVEIPKGVFNKQKYIIMNSYTDPKINTEFTKMFPVFKNIYKELDDVIQNISTMVIEHIPNGFIEDYELNPRLTDLQKKEFAFADYIYKVTQMDYNFDKNMDKNRVVIENNIYRKQNIEKLLELVSDS